MVEYNGSLRQAKEFYSLGDYVSAFNSLVGMETPDEKSKELKFNMLIEISKVLKQKKDVRSVLNCLYELDKIKPNSEDILLNIGQYLERVPDRANALLYYEKILTFNKRSYDALIHIALLFIKIEDYKNALLYIERANKVKRGQYKTAYAYYKLYEGKCMHKESFRYAKEMTILNPNDINGYYYCAYSCYASFNYKQALEYADKYIQCNKNKDDIYYINILCMRILCLKKLGMITDAIPYWEELNKKYPNSYDIKRLYISDLFRNKDYENAMKYYLFVVSNAKVKIDRKKLETKFLEYEKKSYRRENLTGKTLLFYQGPYGHGDYVMFARYIPILAKQADKVIIEAKNNFYNLYKYNFKNAEIIDDTDKAISSDLYDYSISSMELFYAANMNFDNIPYKEGLFDIPEEKILEMRKTGIFDTDKKKIGIFWRGSGGPMKDRNVDLEKYIPLFEMPNCEFYSFDIEKKDEKTLSILEKYNVKDCSSYIKDAMDTCALLKNLDLFITIDSFPLHLAGSIGVKTYLIVPVFAEWRWFNEDGSCSWYNSVKIFRQTETKDIDTVLMQIKSEI